MSGLFCKTEKCRSKEIRGGAFSNRKFISNHIEEVNQVPHYDGNGWGLFWFWVGIFGFFQHFKVFATPFPLEKLLGTPTGIVW